MNTYVIGIAGLDTMIILQKIKAASPQEALLIILEIADKPEFEDYSIQELLVWAFDGDILVSEPLLID